MEETFAIFKETTPDGHHNIKTSLVGKFERV